MTKSGSHTLLYRSWLYFRAGYKTYVALLAGIVFNFLLYEFLVPGNRHLETVFTSLMAFLIPEIALAILISIGFGFYRIRRSESFAASSHTQTDFHGKDKEILYPTIVLTLKGLVKILEHQPFNDDEKREFEEAIAKTNQLIQRVSVGTR